MTKQPRTSATTNETRTQRRRIVGVAAIGLLSFGGVFGTALPAQAAPAPICTGSGYKCDDSGYAAVSHKSFWTMAAGHNCTNYVAWRLIQDGMPKKITWLHNGGDWAREARAHGIPVDKTPTVGSVAQWNHGAGGMSSSGHVAYVTAVTPDSITIAEDNYSSGPMSVRTIKQGDPGWPSHFIHFTAAAMGGKAPAGSTATEWQAFVERYHQEYAA